MQWCYEFVRCKCLETIPGRPVVAQASWPEVPRKLGQSSSVTWFYYYCLVIANRDEMLCSEDEASGWLRFIICEVF